MAKERGSQEDMRARIADYAKRLLDDGGGRATALQPAARHAIEKALQWRTQDRAAAALQAQEYFKRGQGYLSQDLCDEAIAELSQAVVLLERDVEGIHHLALAHQRRWNLHKAPRDKDEALRLARWCLELDPDHRPSFSMMGQLTHPSSQGGADAPKGSGEATARSSNAALFLVLLVFLASLGACAVFGMFVFLSGGDDTRDEEAKPFLSTRHTLPAALVEDAKAEHLRLEVRHSELVNYKDNSWYTLHALLHNERQGEEAAALREVQVKVTLLDDEGREINESTKKFPQFEDLAARPGEAVPLRELIRTDSRPTRAKILITQLALGAYEDTPDKPRKFVSPTQKLIGIKLSLYERSSSQSEDILHRKGKDDDRVYHRAVMKVVNDGLLPVELLKLKAVYRDRRGRKTGEDTTYAVSGSDPPLQPGDARLFLFLESVPARTTTFETHVIDLK